MMDMKLSRRTVLRGAAALGGAGLIGTPALAQSSSGILARMRQAGVARVGLPQSPPWSDVNQQGEISGIGPEVAKIVMQKLGVPKLEAVVANYGDLIPGMMAGRWDFIVGLLTISKARCAQVNFSSPVVFGAEVLAYLPSEISDPPTNLTDIGKRGLKVGVITGSFIIPKMRALIPSDNILFFPDQPALIDGLNAKRIQVASSAYIGYNMMLKTGNYKFSMTEPLTDTPPSSAGVSFRKNDMDLYEAFEAEVKALKQSGVVAEINERNGAKWLRPDYDNFHAQQACEQSL